MRTDWIRPFFIVAALYDILLGLPFLFAYPAIYARFGIALPNHPGYIQFGAAVVTIFGIGFWMVAQAPRRNRDLILLGILFKFAYAGTVLGHLAGGRIPALWVPFAFIDLAFALGFFVALVALPPPARE